MKPHIFAATLIATLFLEQNSPCHGESGAAGQNSGIEEAGMTRGRDIKPFLITREQIASALGHLDRAPTGEALTELEVVFRRYAVLPHDYKTLLSRYSRATSPRKFDIIVGESGVLHLGIEETSGTIVDAFSTYASTGGTDAATHEEAAPLTVEQSLGLLHNFMTFKGRDPKEYSVITRRFGRDTILFSTYSDLRYKFPFRPDGSLDTPSGITIGAEIGDARHMR